MVHCYLHRWCLGTDCRRMLMLSKLFNLPWPPEFFFPDCPCCAPPGDTPWCSEPTKLALQSGQFTSTIKTSEDVGISPTGISWDGTNTLWANPGRVGVAFSKLVLQSGQFTSTIKTSERLALQHLRGINTNKRTTG